MPSDSHLVEPDGDFQCLHEFIEAARAKLPDTIWDYLVGATETETTLKRNRLSLDALAFRPRILRDVSTVTCAATFLGRKSRLPVFLAPVGSLESFHPEGAAEAARGAAEFGVPITVSSVTKPGLEETARASGHGRRIFQLYVRGNDAWVDEHVCRAIDAGYEAFCLTVDTAAYSRRERDITKRFIKPWRSSATGIEFQAALNWDHVKRFKDTHDIPLILKGIATAEDAARACELGVAVVYVSNHGGRQLDHGRGTTAILPEVIEAVRGRAEVWVDGSFSRGTDIVKAIMLGASAIGLGRLYCYGLAAGGASGVARLLDILEHEVGVALALLGVTEYGQLDKSFLHHVEPVAEAHVHSAFPLTGLHADRPRQT